jgi:hypothetical protein
MNGIFGESCIERKYISMKKHLNIAFSVILSDAGEATRALEIADGIRKFCSENYEVDIVFLSTGSRFE